MSHFQEFFKWSVKNLITVPKTQETLREAQTNWEKGTEFKITLEKLRKMDWQFVLYWILEVGSKDFAPIKAFFSVRGLSNKQRGFMVATGGRGWWR